MRRFVAGIAFLLAAAAPASASEVSFSNDGGAGPDTLSCPRQASWACTGRGWITARGATGVR